MDFNTVVLGSIIICQTLSYEYMPLNVGTVLYSAKDCSKKNWNKDELALIHARIYAQKLLPPVNNGVVVNEEYVKSLLNYFKEIYKTVNLENRDAEIGETMNAAVSDALGGFLKSWLLPITKFAFYGGTVSKESAQRTVSFYDDIKNFLRSDGGGWRIPKLADLKHVAITIAPPPALSNTREVKNPCDELAYFEKGDKGLQIPVPSVSWDNSAMMFLPLKQLTLISLNSPTSTNSLYRYYDVAKRCARISNLEAEYDKRFESWLITNVLPHFNDEKLYYGLDSVLTLINKTREVNDKIVNLYINKNNTNPIILNESRGYPSKKVIIITIILFLEICWCIPALFYLKFSKNKNRTRSKDKFLSVCVSYDDKSVNSVSVFGEVKTNTCNEGHSVQFKGKPRLKNKHSDLKQDPVASNPTRLTRSAYPRLMDETLLQSSTGKHHGNVRKKYNILKMDPYCISNASIDTSSSSAMRKTKDKNIITRTKTVTLFDNNDLHKHSTKERQGQTIKPKIIRHAKDSTLKEIPVVLKDATETSSSMTNTKITKIIIARDKNDDVEANKYNKYPKHIKTHKEKGTKKHKTIFLSRKGTKSNVQKPYFEINIEPQETDKANLDGNEPYDNQMSKSTCQCSESSTCENKIEQHSDTPIKQADKDTSVTEKHKNRKISAQTTPNKSELSLTKIYEDSASMAETTTGNESKLYTNI